MCVVLCAFSIEGVAPLVLFVSEPDVSPGAVKRFERLAARSKRVLVCVNRIDLVVADALSKRHASRAASADAEVAATACVTPPAADGASSQTSTPPPSVPGRRPVRRRNARASRAALRDAAARRHQQQTNDAAPLTQEDIAAVKAAIEAVRLKACNAYFKQDKSEDFLVTTCFLNLDLVGSRDTGAVTPRVREAIRACGPLVRSNTVMRQQVFGVMMWLCVLLSVRVVDTDQIRS